MELATIQKVVAELNTELVGAMISKIFQPLPRELAFKLYLQGRGEKRLMLSADPQRGRIHMTTLRIPNPPRPPRFCAFLRAHLSNARITQFSCLGDDRIVTISCELGPRDARLKRNLTLELLGRDSNIIYIDADKNVILDCLHHIPDKADGNRAVYPGMSYQLPPKKTNERSSSVSKRTFLETVDPIPGSTPGGSLSLSTETRQYEGTMSSPTNDRVDAFYSNLLTGALIQNFRREVSRPVRLKIRSLETRSRKIEKDIERLEKYTQQEKYGELLKTVLGSVRKGASKVGVTDWETGETVDVLLNPALAPVVNMRKFFALSAKGKRGRLTAKDRLERTLEEKMALEDLLFFVEEAQTQEELESLSSETNVNRKINRVSLQSQKRKIPVQRSQPPFREYVSPSGLKVFVGKSSSGNDFILRNKAHEGDTWFHVKDAPGSHVILTSRTIAELASPDLLYCASLAALHSRLKNSAKAEVIYTDVKNVFRVKGGALGQVTVRNYKTLIVEPGEEPAN
jgi:predicted ribosome quality control (RQC) complex YloA/Tae2 family protein